MSSCSVFSCSVFSCSVFSCSKSAHCHKPPVGRLWLLLPYRRKRYGSSIVFWLQQPELSSIQRPWRVELDVAFKLSSLLNECQNSGNSGTWARIPVRCGHTSARRYIYQPQPTLNNRNIPSKTPVMPKFTRQMFFEQYPLGFVGQFRPNRHTQ
jgi:hypothetical protein